MKRLIATMFTVLLLLPASTHAADEQVGHTDRVVLKMSDMPKGKWAFAPLENYTHPRQSQFSIYPLGPHHVDWKTGMVAELVTTVYFSEGTSACINVLQGWPLGRTAKTPVWLPTGVGDKEVGVTVPDGYELSFCRGHYFVILIDRDPVQKPNPAIVAGYARLMDSRIKRLG